MDDKIKAGNNKIKTGNNRIKTGPQPWYARRSLWAALVALPLVTAAAPASKMTASGPQPVPEAEQTRAHEAIAAYLEAIQSMKAAFIQEGPDGTMTEGNMNLKRPGKLRFDYGKDSPLLLVSDGKILSFIDYDVKQVTRWPINDTPLGILVSAKVDLTKNLTITSMTEGNGLLRVTVKDKRRPDEGFITLIFDASPLELRAWEVTDQQGLKTRVTLISPQKNIEVADAVFNFKDPRALPFPGNRRR